MANNNGWAKYEKLFLSEMTDNKEFRKEMRELLPKIANDITTLKVKAAIAGGMAGMVGTALTAIFIKAWE